MLKVISWKLTVRATVSSKTAFCQDSWQNVGELPYVYKWNKFHEMYCFNHHQCNGIHMSHREGKSGHAPVRQKSPNWRMRTPHDLFNNVLFLDRCIEKQHVVKKVIKAFLTTHAVKNSATFRDRVWMLMYCRKSRWAERSMPGSTAEMCGPILCVWSDRHLSVYQWIRQPRQ